MNNMPPEQLDIDLTWIEDQLGDRPYGLDVIVPAKYEGKDDGGLSMTRLQDLIPVAHREFLADLLSRYHVPELPEGPLMDVAFSHRITRMANALGPPPLEMIERARSQGIKVAAPNFRSLERRPSYGKWVHAVFVFELVGHEAAVFAAAARDYHIVVTVTFAMAIAQLDQLELALGPIDLVSFVVGEVARRTDAVLIESDAWALIRYCA